MHKYKAASLKEPDSNKRPYEVLIEQQNASPRWLISELTKSPNIPMTEIFHHPVVSRKKNRSNGGTVVIRILYFSISFVMASAFANGTNADKHPYKTTTVKSVVITTNGGWSDSISGHETPEMCKTFLLQKSDIKNFFTKSKQVTNRAYGHDLPAAMCFAEGTITFANGDSGRWKIDQARRGFLTLSNEKTFYFYCPKCSTKVFPEP